MTETSDAFDEVLLRSGRLNDLFAQHLPSLTARARLKGLQPADADEVVQNTVLRVFREISGGKTYRVPIRVVLHMVLGWSIGELRTRQWSLGTADGEPSTRAALGDDFGQAEVDDFLRRAQVGLPPEDRKVCYLFFVMGLRPREIAEVLGKRGNAIHQSLSRIRRRLRDAFDG